MSDQELDDLFFHAAETFNGTTQLGKMTKGNFRAAVREAIAAETAGREDRMRIILELRQKLAIAGVEGSPPPGQETTIGTWTRRAREAETDRDEWRDIATCLYELSGRRDGPLVHEWSAISKRYTDKIKKGG